MASNFLAKGDEYMKKGDKKAKGSFFGNIMNGREERAEAAIEQYKNASTQYKLAQNWEKAAQALLKCAECDQATKQGEAAEFYVEAAGMLKRINNVDYIDYLNKATDIYCGENRIAQAAKLKRQIGEGYEKDLENELAIKFYREAADLFFADNDQSSDYFNMRLKVADLSVNTTDVNYVECIKTYDEVAEKWIGNALTAPSAKKLFFSSILLYMANDDSVGAGIALEKYCDLLPSFNNTRQSKFLASIIQAIQDNNSDDFSMHCYEHNKIIPLDKWQTAILSKIKDKIQPGQLQQEFQDNNNNGEQDVPSQNVDIL